MCGKIRSLEEKSLPPGRDLYEMGAQAVPDVWAGELMQISLPWWPNVMSGDTKMTWNTRQKRKTFLNWLWWRVLGAMYFLGCKSGPFLLILQQPLPGGREKGLLFGWKSRFWTKNPANAGETKKTKSRRKDVFFGRKYKKKQTPSTHFLSSTFKHDLN